MRAPAVFLHASCLTPALLTIPGRGGREELKMFLKNSLLQDLEASRRNKAC